MKLGRFLLPVVALVAPLAQADDLNAAKDMMSEALMNLGNQEVYTLHKTGTEDINGTVTTLESVLVVRDVNPDPKIFDYRIEYRSFRNGYLVNRAAVDGSRVWFYNNAANTYSAYTYNQLADTAQATAVFRTLNKLISTEDQILAQVAQQAYEASLNGDVYMWSKWRPWMSMSTVTELDPGLKYETVSTIPNYRSVIYTASDEPSGKTLTDIGGDTSLTRGGQPIVNTWSISVAYSEHTGTSYAFIPPANSRATTVSLAQGG